MFNLEKASKRMLEKPRGKIFDKNKKEIVAGSSVFNHTNKLQSIVSMEQLIKLLKIHNNKEVRLKYLEVMVEG